MTFTTLAILTAIKTAEWSRYDGAPFEYDESRGYTPFYATAGTSGPFAAIDLRCETFYRSSSRKTLGGYPIREPKPIEYRTLTANGHSEWLPTGFQAVMRYDASRDVTTDDDGWEFFPYEVTELSLTNLA